MTRREQERRTELGGGSERRLPEIISSLCSMARQMHSERGRAREFRRALHRAHVPMVTFANDRRVLDANVASRLLVHLSLEELRRHRVDELITVREPRSVTSVWGRLVEQGQMAGVQELSVGIGATMQIVVVALANVLPGEHLAVLAPAEWSEWEFDAAQSPTPRPARSVLSSREQQVMSLVAVGSSLHEIAEQLTIAEATVRTHLTNAKVKLGARNRAHAVALVLMLGLISSESTASD